MADDSSLNPQAGAGRPLPKKESDLFKNVVKHYELKQYKKAIKLADLILRKFPNHGETLAMKGLTLNYMSKKEEAHEFVKLGLRNDMRSHVCWHVYGLLYRSDRNYNEAIKAYKQALKIDPENLQILRDLSMLQIQMRDLVGFEVTRNQILTLKPNAKINWMAYALSRHMMGELRGAVKVIDTYMSTLSDGCSELGRCFESSELALYKNSILSEIPDNYKEALSHLNVCEGVVVDRGAWLLKRAEYQLRLRDYEAARQTAIQMFQRGMTEHYLVHSFFMCAVLQCEPSIVDEVLGLRGTRTLATLIPLSGEQKEKLVEEYKTVLEPSFPHSDAVARIPYSCLKTDQLVKKLDLRCRKDLSKGVPSLCSELCSYFLNEQDGRLFRVTDPIDYKSNTLYKTITAMVDGYISNLTLLSKFSEIDEAEEPSSTLLWAWYLRASLHEVAGEYCKGLALLDNCIEHTPTIVDVYELKARLLRSAGDIDAAVECLEKGRNMDLQDRYINNQTTKYMLQAGKEDQALNCISLFTKHEGNPEHNLFEMQCSWYELELAACLAKKQDWGRSLKKYSAVIKHFDDFNEDQFDFHSYCLRKVTLRAYVSVLRFEDVVFGEEYYCKAAAGTIRIYLHLADNPLSSESGELDYSQMTAAERKKAKAIARKKKKTEEKKSTEHEQEAQNGHGGEKTTTQGVVDEDPLGNELLQKDPLDEARKYSAMLTQYAPKSLETWTLQYDVALRRKKTLMAMQALFKGLSVEEDSSEIFTRIVDFSLTLGSLGNVPTVVKTVIDEEAPKLLGGKTVTDFVQAAADRIRSNTLTDLHFRSAVARAMVDTNSGPASEAASLITDGGIDSRNVTLQSCKDAMTVLESFGADASLAVESWTNIVRQRFEKAASVGW